jgi:hypothetical protein
MTEDTVTTGAPVTPPAVTARDRVLRWSLGVLGVPAIGYGILRILDQSRYTHPSKLILWLIGALLVHDAIIAPVVICIGAVLTRLVPGRARAYLQGALIAAGLVSVVAAVEIYRQGKTASPALALLRQHYLANLLILLALIAAVSAAGYAVSVQRCRRTKSRPPADH